MSNLGITFRHLTLVVVLIMLFVVLLPPARNQAAQEQPLAPSVTGDLDLAYIPTAANSSSVNVVSLATQSDGKILVGGFFSVLNGVARNRIARLNADGTLDTSFGAGQSGADEAVYAIVVQPDGKILIGGYFTRVNGVAPSSCRTTP